MITPKFKVGDKVCIFCSKIEEVKVLEVIFTPNEDDQDRSHYAYRLQGNKRHYYVFEHNIYTIKDAREHIKDALKRLNRIK